ncbi:hypothetical protein SAMD00019534_097650 [Acytostelium subglobosum LB1]|uniref:hypothetical protein n=1 Tax=Acytostelium subglobosum LB1 TaxID=1410327 RepID=UPI000644BD45|nr:hypothetical protein SAMD00019534_097650 [Acytostelium subglobosum LB1]GAM26590.1 hypothetical protein SAMD00019534_097650 [Acytostelium subglobosum LB1]|eukprot:XP_012750251.1 hypothetical protein SAMD00019534_097650 [Acytostelium subglobosum LB1]
MDREQSVDRAMSELFKINKIDILNNPVKYESPMMDSTGSPMNSTFIALSTSSINSSSSGAGANKISPSSSAEWSIDSDKDKKTRRFSLYVYQKPTDEQRKQISELYGYMSQSDGQSYTYSHDSSHGILGEDVPSTLSRTTSLSINDINLNSSNSNNNNNNNNSHNNYNNVNNKTNDINQSTPISKTTTINNTSLPQQQQQQQAQAQQQILAYPHTVVPYNLPPAIDSMIPEPKTLKPPDPSQLPHSYLSTVAKYPNSYSEAIRASGAYKPSYVPPGYIAQPGGGYAADEYNEKESILKPILHPPLSSAKDWNAEYQTLVNNNKMEGYRDLSKLAHDFVYTAKIYGKVIISELTLPLHLKTIKPINIGGVAGGHKYIALGILFKLALDSQGLYVGDQNAMKAAGHELKGLMSYYNARVDGLHHPLMALIDYRGYRLVAMSLLPINGETIVYGSSDGGITVHNQNELFNEKMKKSASILNIKEHMVGRDNPKLLHCCGDIEGHIGSDGHFYLLDFARVFPPILKLNDHSPPSHLYELIRPELVKSNTKPLSSDAFTGWGKFDPNTHEHNYEVKEASYRLFLQVIPKFASFLQSLEITDMNELHLTQELHRVGINCRYMGLVRRLVRCQSLRRMMLGEILARTMKCEIMALFRGKMKTADTPSEEPFKDVVVTYLNRIFKYEHSSKGKQWPASLRTSISKKFWGTFQIMPKDRESISFESILNKRFDEDKLQRHIRSSELLEEDMLIDDVDIQVVMKRFNQLTGVGLTKRAMKEILKQDRIRLVPSDVKRMKAKVKTHHLVEFAEGMVLWDEAKKEKNREKLCGRQPTPESENSDRIAERLLTLADDHFRSALALSPHSGEVSANWALMLVECARITRMNNPKEADIHYSAAEEKLRTSVCDGGKPKITLDNVLLEYAEFLCIWGTHHHLELDMNEANGLRSKVFNRAGRKIMEAIQINPSKFTLVMQKANHLEKSFHESESFKEAAAYYAGCAAIMNCLILCFEKLPASHHREIADAITQNLSPIQLIMKEKEASESPDLVHRSIDDTFSYTSTVSCRKDENEIKKLLEIDPFAIIRIEMGYSYIRYGYLSHVYGIMCSKRNHTKMASIKLLKKSGSLFQKGIDMDPYNRDILVDHIKRFTSSSQFVEFYQTAIGCPSILDFVEDRLLRIAHMSLKDCSHLPIEFIEGIIEYSPKVKMLVLDGCTQITDSTIELIVKKLPYLESLSLTNCTKVTTIISPAVRKQYSATASSSDKPFPHSPVSLAHHHHFSSQGNLADASERDKKQTRFTGGHHIVGASINILAASALVTPHQSQLTTQPTPPAKPLSFLHTLNLNKCKSITDEKLIALANLQLPLVNIYLKKCNIGDQSIIQLSQNCPKLAIIKLSGCKNIGDASVYSIAVCCLGLRELSLNGCPLVTSNSVDKLIRTLHDIRLISLSNTPIAASDNTLRLIGKYCKDIQYVSLAHNNIITETGVYSLVRHNSTIQELNISHCPNISDHGITHIALNCNRLRKLKMVGLNNVTTLKAIGNNCSELVELDISECHKISSDLGYITKGCPKLTNFRLRRCYGMQDLSLLSADGEMHSMNKLTVLDWSYGNIEFQTIHSITHSCKSLTSLNISFCKSLTDTSLERIASDLTNLKKLKIDSIINITDDGIKALSEVQPYPKIQVFSLVGCRKISDIAAQYILELQDLKKLSLGGSLITTAGAQRIASESFELVKMNIRNCLNINPAAIREKHPHIIVQSTQKETAYFSE